MTIKVKVITGAPRSQIFVLSPEQLKVKLVSPPEKGRANRELIELLADHFGVAKSRVRIVRGEKTHNKIVEIIIES
jgi:uncharacterized protein (TIGR00251 family)